MSEITLESQLIDIIQNKEMPEHIKMAKLDMLVMLGVDINARYGGKSALLVARECGNEAVYDIIYKPEETPIMLRAKAAGCKVENGYSMLKYQGYKQFSLFTGVEYE